MPIFDISQIELDKDFVTDWIRLHVQARCLNCLMRNISWTRQSILIITIVIIIVIIIYRINP